VDLEYDADDPIDLTAEPKAKRDVSEEAGMNVRSAHRGKPVYQQGTCPSGQSACRQDDTYPWYGGDMLGPHHSPGQPFDGSFGLCSSGFSVMRTTGSNVYRTLTASHCEDTPVTWTDGGGDLYTVASTSGPDTILSYPEIDSLLLHPDAGLTGGYVYTGAAVSNVTTKVTGPVSNFTGGYVLTDGGNSGVHVLKIDGTNVAATCPGDVPCLSAVMATVTHPESDIGGAQGDSGGPVVSDNGQGGYSANGIITQGRGSYVICPSGMLRYPTLCSNSEIYISIKGIMNYYAGQGKPIQLVPPS
jgi:hypothetical protein